MVTIYFDTETNLYLKKNGNEKIKYEDVLELAMIKMKDGEILEKYHRYYYPDENAKFNPMTSKIHGLYENTILKKRKEHFQEMVNNNEEFPFYPKHFLKDLKSLENFIKDCDELVAHNLKFDIKFIPEHIIDKYNIKTRCTMLENKDLVEAVDKNGRKKNPRLEELAEKLGVEFNKEDAHSGIYDVTKLMECDLIIQRDKEINQSQMTFDFD